MKKIIFSLLLTGVFLSGCRDWLDINYNPNATTADNVTLYYFLAPVQTRMAYTQSSYTNIHFLSHHMTKSGTVGGTYNFLTGLLQSQDSNTYWQLYFQYNADLVNIINKAVALDLKSFQGIARTLLVNNFQMLVDMFGDIPYTEALKGAELMSPAYDKADYVYASLLSDIDVAIADLTAAKASDQQALSRQYNIATYDVMCKGDIDQWLRFANSLKLRLLMRVSGVQNVSSEISALVNNCLRYDEMITCNPGYQKLANKMRPFYANFGWNQTNAEVNGHNYYRPTRDIVDMLRNNNDPRMIAYIQPRQLIVEDPDKYANYTNYGLVDEPYIGIPFGQQNPPNNQYTSGTSLGVLGGSASMNEGPVSATPIMGGFEVQFYLAEAALNGIIPGGDAAAQKYYEDGVKGSFIYREAAMQAQYVWPGYAASYSGNKPPITTSASVAADEYLLQDNSFCNWSEMASADDKLNAIATQKWIALFGINPYEAWFEHRRLDLPELGCSVQSQELKNICILPYPQSEVNYNGEHVGTYLNRNVTNDLVFWDKTNPQVSRVSEYL